MARTGKPANCMRHFSMLCSVSQHDKYFIDLRKKWSLIACNGGKIVKDSVRPERYLRLFYPEDESSTILRNFSNYLPVVRRNI